MDQTQRTALRAGAVVAAAAAQALIPSVVPLTGVDREEQRRGDTPITPPPYAFSIWGPIFAASIANAVQQALPAHRAEPVNEVGGWPLAGAHALNAAWALAAQPGRFATTPFVLAGAVACAATAYRQQQREEAPGIAQLAPASTGLLLGWISLASVVNTASVVQELGAEPDAPLVTAIWTAAAVALAGVAGATILRSRHGYLPLATSVGWGLGTTAMTSERPRLARAGALAGTVIVAAASVARLLRARPW